MPTTTSEPQLRSRRIGWSTTFRGLRLCALALVPRPAAGTRDHGKEIAPAPRASRARPPGSGSSSPSGATSG